MVYANATYLWGLLGLLIPIAIHLWSRKKVKTIKIGSTKLLQASEPKQTSSIKLNELLLLFLRLLTILLLVFILAEPSIQKINENLAINYLIEPSLMNDERMGSILDTIPKESIRVLANEFPPLDDYDIKESFEPPIYWQLAQQMHLIPADSIVVFSRGLVKGLQGKRPMITANTRWIVIEPDVSHHEVLEIVEKESYAQVLSTSSDGFLLTFKKDTIPLTSDLIEIKPERDSVRLSPSNSKDWLVFKKNNPIQIGIVNNDTLKEQIRYFRAAYRSISKFLNRPVEVEILENYTGVDDDFDIFISFDSNLSGIPEATVILYKPDEFADDLISEGPTKNVFHLTKLLDSENIVKEHLPEKLLQLLGLNRELKDIINSNDKRTVVEKVLQPNTSEENQTKNIAGLVEFTPWLWLFLIFVVVIERILSKLRKQ